MPNQTEKLKLNTWLESDTVNFEEINANFEKLDAIPMIIGSGKIGASYTLGAFASATWHYNEYSNGEIEMWTKLEYTNLPCTTAIFEGANPPYYSESSQVNFPLKLSEVQDVQMHLASSKFSWISNITGSAILDHINFRLFGMEYESSEAFKQVFVHVKGSV